MGILDTQTFLPQRGARTSGTLGQAGEVFDLTSNRGSRNAFAPAFALSSLFQDPGTQDFLNPEQDAMAVAEEGILGGAADMQRESFDLASRLGLDRGFAASQTLRSRQAAIHELSGAMAAARMLGSERRALALSRITEALIGGQRLRYQAHAANRAREAAISDMYRGLLIEGGSALAGALTAAIPGVGKVVGPAVGSAGAALGSQMQQQGAQGLQAAGAAAGGAFNPMVGAALMSASKGFAGA